MSRSSPRVPPDEEQVAPTFVRMVWEAQRARVIVQAARLYVKRAARSGVRYDLIVLDAFNGEYIPEQLMTRECLEACRAILGSDGVLVANTFSTSRFYDSESLTSARRSVYS